MFFNSLLYPVGTNIHFMPIAHSIISAYSTLQLY